MLMSFENQKCVNCKHVKMCYEHIVTRYGQTVRDWLCNDCYGWIIEHAEHKDEVLQIMIACNIRDLEK